MTRLQGWTGLCVLVTVANVSLLISAELGDHTQQIVRGYFAMLLFVFVSAPLHLVVGAVALVLVLRKRRPGPGRWVLLYLAAWFVFYGGVMVAHGIHESLLEAVRG